MKMKVVLFSTLLLALHTGAASAEPRNGVGLNVGLVNDNMDATPTPAGVPFSYSSSGMSLGVDYQIALPPNLSLNPFLMLSSESTSGALKPGTTAGHGILGVQLRYWAGDLFVGGHLARYTEALLPPNTPTVGTSGFGAGLAGGWEQPNGGVYVLGQMDWATLQYVDANVKLSGFRVSAGYRFK